MPRYGTTPLYPAKTIVGRGNEEGMSFAITFFGR